jgi:GT2 family glycosyltransferase
MDILDKQIHKMIQMGTEKSDEFPLVSIIVLNYNGREFLDLCIGAILNSSYPNFETMFVDNGSTDGSVDYVKLKFSSAARLRIIALDRNYGFTKGNNIGASYINERAKYIVFLNPDTQVDKHWLLELVRVMESDLATGMAQSLLLDYNKHQVIQCAGIYMIDFCGWTWALFRGLSYDRFADHFSQQPIEIFAAMGAAMIMRRDLFYDIGCFDPEFFMFSDEADLAWRVWLTGYKVMLVPRSIVYHALGGSIESLGELRNVFAERHRNKNVMRMLIKNYDSKHLFLYLPIAVTLMYIRALYYAFIKRRISPLAGFIQAIMWNLLNLQSTLCRRRYVQRVVRKVPIENLSIMRKRLPLSEIISRMK